MVSIKLSIANNFIIDKKKTPYLKIQNFEYRNKNVYHV